MPWDDWCTMGLITILLPSLSVTVTATLPTSLMSTQSGSTAEAVVLACVRPKISQHVNYKGFTCPYELKVIYGNCCPYPHLLTYKASRQTAALPNLRNVLVIA